MPLHPRSFGVLLAFAFGQAFALFSSCPNALAETTTSRGGGDATSSSVDGRVPYEEGVRAFAAGRYADAVDRFREADRRAPSPALSFNMARAYEKLGNDASALNAYREYLRRAESPDDAVAVGRIVHTLAKRLSTRGIQQVTVLSVPPGATVFLDGERVGITPATLETKPGVHTLTLALTGYAEENRPFQLPMYDPVDVRVALHEDVPPPTPATVIREAPAARPHPLVSQAHTAHTRGPASARPFRTAGIIALGAGGAALGGALAFELLRRSEESTAKNEQEQLRLADDIDTIRARRTAARVLGGIGVGLAAIGGALLIASPSGAPPQDMTARMKLDVTASGLTAIVSGRF